MSLPDRSRIAFSFSGLLAATERRIILLRKQYGEDRAEAIQREMARVFQQAVVGHLCRKLEHAISSIRSTVEVPLGGLVVSGGVASNLYLRQQYV